MTSVPRLSLVPVLFLSVAVVVVPSNLIAQAACDDQLSSGSVVLGVPAKSNGPDMGSGCSCAGDTYYKDTNDPCHPQPYVNGTNGRCPYGAKEGTLGCRYGVRYQCVEYVRRFYSLRSDTQNTLDPNTWPNLGAGIDFYNSQSGVSLIPKMTQIPNQSGSQLPSVGDIIVFSGGNDGHVAVVSAVNTNSNGEVTGIDIVEENFSTSGTYPLPVQSDGTVGEIVNGIPKKRGNSFTIVGWLHLTALGSSPPTSPAPVIGRLVTNPMPTMVGDFNIIITGASNVDTTSVFLYLTGPKCTADKGQYDCVGTVLSKSATALTAAVNILNQGDYYVYLQNGATGTPSLGWHLQVQAPVPSITGLVPSSLPLASVGQTVLINGNGFTPTAALTFNNQYHFASYVNPTQMSMLTTYADVSSTGNYPVIVTNPAPGGGPSATLYLQVTTAPIPSQNPTIANLYTNPSPTDAGIFDVHITGTNFETSDVQVYVTGTGCPVSSPCVIPHSVLSGVMTTALTAPATIDNAGQFNVYVQNGVGGVSSSPWSLTVNPPAYIQGIQASTNPVHVGSFNVTITGNNFDISNVQVYLLGPGCKTATSCLIPRSVLSSVTTTTLKAPVTINNSGQFTVYVQNDSGGVPSNGLPLSVSP